MLFVTLVYSFPAYITVCVSLMLIALTIARFCVLFYFCCAPYLAIKVLDEIRVDTLKSAPGSRHRHKRKGRGIAAGQGASCGFGMRGQKSRSGPGVRAGFEGGQTALYRRLPKLVGRPMGPGHTKKVSRCRCMWQVQVQVQ